MKLLLDTASLWYRAYFGMPDTLVSPSGMPVHLIRGVTDMVARLITKYDPTEIAVCLDSDWRPSWRVELIPEYKAHRVDAEDEEVDESMSAQIPILLELFAAAGFPLIGISNFEADDVIATLAHESTLPVMVVTGDRDLFQLVDDGRDIKIAYLAKGVSAHDVVDEQWIENKYGIPGRRYALFALLRGDPSDGLPGVKGIGEKSAALLANAFASVDEIVAAAHTGHEALPASIQKKILAGLDYLERAPRVVACALDVPIPDLDLKRPDEWDAEHMKSLQKEFGLGASVDRLLAALAR
ncbi:MAG: 5'-3' exonuclease [Actinobacteria bacterium]|nr:5'-3' exonuclease [Actinomycetota bacterium]NBP90977.1 5'-3' exonuclease [Actinomycetota bacterium]